MINKNYLDMQTNLKKSSEPLLSVDWFSTWGHYLPQEETGKYHFVGDTSCSAMWTEIRVVAVGDKRVGTLCCKPRSNMLGEDVAMFTADNALLYDCGWFLMFQDAARNVGFSIETITRCDIALDFQVFANDITPTQLINSFFTGKLRKVGQSKWRAVGECKEELTCEYLAFGSRTSAVFTRLYNKSKELREQTMKTYIVDMWEKGGMCPDTDVWRLEFQIQAKDFKFVHASTGEEGSLLVQYFVSEYPLEDLARYLCGKYFDFRYQSSGKNVSRWRRVDLFGDLHTDIVRLSWNSAVKTSRAEKVLLSALHHYCRKYKSSSDDIILACRTLINDLTIKGHMWEWYKSKSEDWYDMPSLTQQMESKALFRIGRQTELFEEEE